ncbi:hypothetical protein AOC36_04805 [Erysipelothrix larvae]|uniref:DhaL domain-containing protein n=1 Tax=Erysipelothrix larvae TaxID=1514105 RepID=A0A109UGW7_9FIRM|nr:DAK2 domain-containing protein [Erysipelothrix larvae]AMC93317.1 hypothetical protein AOC36_04805 [Erysipelothrix larvae]
MTLNINGDLFLKMLESGANNLSNKHHEINALNVFPVPDGDTGTNMNLTFTNGLSEARKIVSSNIGDVSKTLSRGLLMGARGNSGVILSQIFRGFAQSVESLKEADLKAIANAFQNGKTVAYKAVMRPVEGTILTVLRESAQAAYDWTLLNQSATLEEYFEVLLAEANKSLEHTPELLPVLKEVGVVDSGGAGYVAVIEGFLSALKGEIIEAHEVSEDLASAGANMESDEFGYCTEFIVQLDPNASRYDEQTFRSELESLGNSIVVVTDEDLVKVHVHTLKPGNALNLGQRYGEFLKLKIENMTEQHHTIMESDVPHATKPVAKEHSKYAIVSVAAGDGIVELFNELRAEYIISGGQTMNPSTEDFIEMINTIDADHIIVLPNNSNIIMAAKQAQDLLEDKDIRVLETKSIPQGLAACVMFNPEVDIDENIQEMVEAIQHTKTGQVTYAIKDTVFDSIEIKANDFMGILEKDIVVSGQDKQEITKRLIDQLIDDDSALVTLLAGEDTTEDQLNDLVAYIESTFDVEVEAHFGDQPVYAYIIGVE